MGAAMADKRVLEIGCGRGIVVRYLRNHGVDCFGTELAPVDVDPHLAPYINANRDCFDLPDEVRRRVDALLLLDVIEHLPEPVQFMRRLREAFPAAQALVVTVPARTELWSSYDTYYGHFRRYTIKSVSAEVRDAGFGAIEAGYFFMRYTRYCIALANFLRPALHHRDRAEPDVVASIRRRLLFCREPVRSAVRLGSPSFAWGARDKPPGLP